MFAISTLFAAVLALNSTVLGEQACATTQLPNSLKTLLEHDYAGWRPESISDLSQDDQRLWQIKQGNRCPGIAVGHLKSTQLLGYALLLVPASHPASEYKLVVFSSQRSGSFNSEVLDHTKNKLSSGPVVSTVPPGEYSEPETGKTVRVGTDSILVEWIEAAAALHYWSGGHFHSLQVSD